MEEKDLVKAQGKDVVEFTGDLGFTGFEGIENDAGAFSIAFLKIAQALSHELDEDDDAYIPNLKKGDFFNSVTGEILGDNINAIVVYTERVFNEYKPNRGGFVGTHPRVEGEKLIRDKGEYPFVNGATGNDLVETITMIMINADDPTSGAIVFPMSSMMLKHGKAFLSRTSMLRTASGERAPLFSQIYNFKTVKQSNDNGVWYQPVKNSITKVGGISAEHVPEIKKAFELFQSEGVDYAKEEKGNQDSSSDSTGEDRPF